MTFQLAVFSPAGWESQGAVQSSPANRVPSQWGEQTMLAGVGERRGEGRQILCATSNRGGLKPGSLWFAATVRNQGTQLLFVTYTEWLSFLIREGTQREQETSWPISCTHCQSSVKPCPVLRDAMVTLDAIQTNLVMKDYMGTGQCAWIAQVVQAPSAC